MSILSEWAESHENEPTENEFTGLVYQIEDLYRGYNLNHRFVGGVLTEAIGEQTTFDIDIENHTIVLVGAESISATRENGTWRDIDSIAFTPDLESISSAKEILDQEDFDNPLTLHPAIHEGWPLKLRPPVFAEFYVKGDSLYLSYNNINVALPWEAIEPWTLHYSKDAPPLTILNPVAHVLSYHTRLTTGLKVKDEERMAGIERLAAEVERKDPRNYSSLYAPWQSFIELLQETSASDSIESMQKHHHTKALRQLGLVAIRTLVGMTTGSKFMTNVAQGKYGKAGPKLIEWLNQPKL